MTLELIDWILIVAYFVFSVGIALLYAKRAGKNLGEFFLGGRSLPWYLAGISMVATTFAADTPLAVTELVVQKGISGNWLWWNMCIGGMLTTFFFAKLWRRANVLTEVEFITLRYAGNAAHFLRGFKAVYLGFLMNVLVMGWVNVAMSAILQEFFNLSSTEAFWYTAAAMAIVGIYSSVGGFMSVAVTDAFQFVLAMGGCIVLAILVLNSDKIGGIDGLKEKLGPDNAVWNMLPSIGSDAGGAVKAFSITFASFFAYIGLQWWASWYPGGEPGGGGYVAQRMMSTKTERGAVFATLFFQVAHFCLRPWPWIIVALCCIVLYPNLPAADAKLGYVMAMKEFLPTGLRGLMLVSFFAAYMSTIATQLNWGASYLVNDLYMPARKRQGLAPSSDKQLIFISRMVTIVLMVVAMAVSSRINSISEVWAFMIECGAGLGLVLILRWFWWRINVWSEISATVAPFVIYAALKFGVPEAWGISEFPTSYFITIGGTTLVWLLVTLFTKPEPMAHLVTYHKQVQPGGWWKPVAEKSGIIVRANTVPLVMAWISSVLMTYATLFAIGQLIFKNFEAGFIFLGVATAAGLFLWLVLREWKLFENEE
ncbi:MAG: Na+:solute symporter [Bacteroidetes bacterium]|nr:Na+:solute symporter [Bacteroidota bacterium]